MFKLSKLESRTQEVTLLLTVVTGLSVLLTSWFFLYLKPDELSQITGRFGSIILQYTFSVIGYGAFVIALSVFFIGRLLVLRSQTLSDIWQNRSVILYHVCGQICVIGATSALLTVFQSYFAFDVNQRLSSGAGGILGILIGGNLFQFFGIYGSLTILGSFVLVTGIASGFLELVSITLWTHEKLQTGTVGLFHLAIKAPVKIYGFLRERLKAKPTREEESSVVIPLTDSQIPPMVPKIENTESLVKLVKRRVRKKKKVEAADTTEASNAKKTNSSSDVLEKLQKPEPVLEETLETAEPSEDSTPKPLAIEVLPWKHRYNGPDIHLLKKGTKDKSISKTALDKLSNEITERLTSFQATGKVIKAHHGDRLTMFEFQPDPGVKLSKIASLSDDLALVLGADAIRVLTPIPGKSSVGMEVPNKEPHMVTFSDLVPALHKAQKTKELPIALGKDVYNDVHIASLTEMPHILISGTTGSGKSVFINTLILSLLFTKSPKELRFLMVDPKMIELSPYNGIPHLLQPVVTDVVEAKDLLVWAEKEMDRRYQVFAETGARNLQSFNEKIDQQSQASLERRMNRKFSFPWETMPQIVIVIDELADLMITQGKDVEIPITRIAQKARAAGIHMVIATQRPSAEIVTGLIKTNFPTRVAFKVSSSIDSRTILDTAGAERLLGHGDMLYMAHGKGINRMQGAFVSEQEVKKVVEHLISQNKK